MLAPGQVRAPPDCCETSASASGYSAAERSGRGREAPTARRAASAPQRNERTMAEPVPAPDVGDLPDLPDAPGVLGPPVADVAEQTARCKRRDGAVNAGAGARGAASAPPGRRAANAIPDDAAPAYRRRQRYADDGHAPLWVLLHAPARAPATWGCCSAAICSSCGRRPRRPPGLPQPRVPPHAFFGYMPAPEVAPPARAAEEEGRT